MCTHACKKGLNRVLTQNGHVMSYESRKLKRHENNYATYGLKPASIAHALKIWRYNLMGRKFELRIKYDGLKYLFKQPILNSK